MTRLTKLAVGIGSLGLVATLAVPLAAQRLDGPRGRTFHEGRLFGRGFSGLALRGLDLTDAQREQVRGIVSARRAEFRALGDRLRAAHEAQRLAVTRIPVDENEIRARVSELAAVQADAAVLRARVHEQVFQVLTPEQQTKAKSLAAERDKRRAERQERFKQRLQERQQRRQQQQPQQQ
jgi:Spy/CpxP family protein refolding chaperone